MKEFIRNPFQQLQTNEKKVAIMERYFSWQFAVKELKKKGIVRRPDPYYIIKKMVGEIGEVVVFRSKKKRSTLSAQWQAECIAETLLHGGDPHRPIIIEVWDQNIGTDKFIGSVNTSAAELLNERQEFQLINQKQRKKLKDNYTHSGILQVIKVHSEGREKFVMNPFFGRNRFNLLAYLNGGCKVHLHLAVDWTKDPALPPDDPYHLPKERHRRYFEAPLSSIVYALCDLFRETSVAAFCIGGKPKHSKNKPQPPCFALNSCEDKPFVDCHRLSDTYAKALQELRFSNHAPLSSAIATVVEQVKHSIKEQQEGIQAYHVLVIVTWGQPTEQERQRTAKHIVLASNKPLSIVFVGVGTSKLDAMRTLAQYPLVADNKEAARPTVLIVKHKHFEQHGDNSFQQVLANQITSYMALRDIAPNYRPLSSPQQQHETAPASTFFKPLTPVGDSYASPHYASPPVFSHQQPPPSPSQPDVVIGQHPPQQMIGWTPSPFVGGEATSSLAWNSPPPQHHSNARLEDEALYSLLQSLGYLEKYGALFARESLTLEALKRFTKQDMQEVLGLPAGPRIAIYNALHPTQ
ncbi:Copine-1 [Balamuthia mandrillaris]